MKMINGSRIILTGAAGGLGREIALRLAAYDCKLGLVGRNKNKLEELSAEIKSQGGEASIISADITVEADRTLIINTMTEQYEGIDMLVNNAAIMSFNQIENKQADLEQLMATNVIAPIRLCQLVLPELQKSKRPHIVNIGSTFGSLGYACFSYYSASKFALRGFSESLRRELADSAVIVSYYAPRAIKTSLNNSAIMNMAQKTKMTMDPPEIIAQKIVLAIAKGQKEKYFGFPESLFAKINAIFPRLIDIGVSAETQIMKKYCA